MKYAIVEDGGKQFKAVEGGTIEVDHYEAEVGDPIGLERVLMVVDGENVTVGTPIVSGAKLKAQRLCHSSIPRRSVFAKRRVTGNSTLVYALTPS